MSKALHENLLLGPKVPKNMLCIYMSTVCKYRINTIQKYYNNYICNVLYINIYYISI